MAKGLNIYETFSLNTGIMNLYLSARYDFNGGLSVICCHMVVLNVKMINSTPSVFKL